jgi:hypothetical protein
VAFQPPSARLAPVLESMEPGAFDDASLSSWPSHEPRAQHADWQGTQMAFHEQGLLADRQDEGRLGRGEGDASPGPQGGPAGSFPEGEQAPKPLRRGKWSPEEEAYVQKIISVFQVSPGRGRAPRGL